MTTLTIAGGTAVRLPVAARARRAATLHLTRRGRLVLLLVGLAILIGGLLVATRAAAGGPTGAPEVQRYVVAPGDTLWAIASGMAQPGDDVRDVVRHIQLLNDMPSAQLIAGQQLLLPVSS